MKLPPDLEARCLELAGEKPKANPRWSESQFQAAVIALAKRLGWLCYHTHDSRRSESGFPDLVLVRPRDGRLLCAELKVGKNRPTGPQRLWLDALNAAGVTAVVWRASDWAQIVEELR